MITKIILATICVISAIVAIIFMVRVCINTYRIEKIYRFEVRRQVDELNRKIWESHHPYIREGAATPAYWVFTVDREIVLLLSNMEYLKCEEAMSQYPEYFDKDGKPLLDRLPFRQSMGKRR